jgi:hypothetical protein
MPQFQDIQSTGHSKLIQKHIIELGHFLLASNIPARVDCLEDCNDSHLTKTLEDEITPGMKSPGRKCKMSTLLWQTHPGTNALTYLPKTAHSNANQWQRNSTNPGTKRAACHTNPSPDDNCQH